ncbi:hypothetical protein BDZ45DRAFT_692442 [Acephala macrosclerotiorum]|nr:hypothetical protein BDZ45DRAFT_692442 [Acephala macrosclerotiorum]
MATLPSTGLTLDALGLMPGNINLTFVQRLKFEELRTPRTFEETINRCVRYYEASNNRFFLSRIGDLLKDLKNGKLEGMGMIDDIEEDDLLCVTFALGDGPLTTEEAKKLSEMILGDDRFQAAFDHVNNSGREVPYEVALQAYGPEIVSGLKKALLEINSFLRPDNVLNFLALACPMGCHLGFHKATVEVLKDIKEKTPAVAKTSLITPELQLQLKVQKEIVRKFEGHLQKLKDTASKGVGVSILGLRDAFLGLDLLNRDVGDVKVVLGLRHFETDVAELEALGVTEV